MSAESAANLKLRQTGCSHRDGDLGDSTFVLAKFKLKLLICQSQCQSESVTITVQVQLPVPVSHGYTVSEATSG